jgi:hypothetical protein
VDPKLIKKYLSGLVAKANREDKTKDREGWWDGYIAAVAEINDALEVFEVLQYVK